MACPACAERAKFQMPKDSHTAYGRGILFGVGGAIAGLILYATVEIVTGLIIGYVALAVGYLVGHSIKKGSGGRGGRRYQIAALILTYFSVSLASIPVIIAEQVKHAKERKAQQAAPDTSIALAPAGGDASKPAAAPDKSAPVNVGRLLGLLFLFGLASPFLSMANPLSGLIGLFILSIGLRIAWRTTAGVDLAIDGPFGGPSGN